MLAHRVVVWFLGFSLYYCRMFTLQYKAPSGDCDLVLFTVNLNWFELCAQIHRLLHTDTLDIRTRRLQVESMELLDSFLKSMSSNHNREDRVFAFGSRNECMVLISGLKSEPHLSFTFSMYACCCMFLHPLSLCFSNYSPFVHFHFPPGHHYNSHIHKKGNNLWRWGVRGRGGEPAR